MITQIYKQPVCEPMSVAEAKLHLRIDSAVTVEDDLIGAIVTSAREWCEMYEHNSYIVRTYKAYLDCFTNYIILPHGFLVYVDSVQYYDSAGTLQTLDTDIYTVDTDSLPPRIYLAYNQSWPSTYDIPKSVIITYTIGVAAKFIGTYAASTPTLTMYGRTPVDGEIVRVGTSSGGTLPTGLSADTDYYIINTSGQTFQLSLTAGGSAVSVTAASSGMCFIGRLVPKRVLAAMKLMIAHLYENRIEVSPENYKQIPMGCKNLLFERIFT
jgi:uncharacterized phiE125 gp8 family phage protein